MARTRRIIAREIHACLPGRDLQRANGSRLSCVCPRGGHTLWIDGADECSMQGAGVRTLSAELVSIRTIRRTYSAWPISLALLGLRTEPGTLTCSPHSSSGCAGFELIVTRPPSLPPRAEQGRSTKPESVPNFRSLELEAVLSPSPEIPHLPQTAIEVILALPACHPARLICRSFSRPPARSGSSQVAPLAPLGQLPSSLAAS